MKIYIVGSVGSGKTTLARQLSAATGIPCYHLDEVQHDGLRRRTDDERDSLFAEILAKEHYIIEDTGRKAFFEGLRQTDTIVLLNIPLFVCRKHIITRWFKQKLGIEKCGYKPNFKMLRLMFMWSKNYASGADGLKSRLEQFSGKNHHTLHHQRN